MTRIIVFLIALAIGGGLLTQILPSRGHVTVTDARAVPVGLGERMFMVSLTLDNQGAAVTLTGATSPAGAEVSVMSPTPGRPLVLPAMDTAQLAMDGAHLMLTVTDGSFEEGTFHPLSLVFDDGSEVVARVLRPMPMDGMAMTHGGVAGVEASPPPTIAFAAPPTLADTGLTARVTLENLALVRVDDMAPHVPGEGHAHVYLNGLKLGRLYDERIEIGALPPGDHVLQVSLNTNDHRPYLADGTPVVAEVAFQVP